MNCDLVIIPGGMTSQLQVMDVVVNKAFKDIMHQQYNKWLLHKKHSNGVNEDAFCKSTGGMDP